MKVKYVVSVEAPEFGQELFLKLISATFEAFNQRKTYNAGIIDREIAPKYARRKDFNFVEPRELPEEYEVFL